MKKILTNTFLILVFTTQLTYGQDDTVEIKAFMMEQTSLEEVFIDLVKRNRTDSAMLFFSTKVLDEYGEVKLRKELKELNELFTKYSNVKNTSSIGIASGGVGTFGQDAIAKYETSSLYQFYEKEELVFYFKLHYDDTEPVGEIIHYESMSFSNSKPSFKIEP